MSAIKLGKPTPPTAPPQYDIVAMITFQPPICGIGNVPIDERERKINLQLAKDILQQIERAQKEEKVKIVYCSDVVDWIEKLSQEGFSALHVNIQYEVELPFYNIQIPLPPLAKAIYILYMRHPEGFYRKQIAEKLLRSELTQIYQKLRPNNSDTSIAKTIDDLCNFEKKNLDRQVCIINRAFRSALGEMASYYLPSGKKGQPRALDFEHISFGLPDVLKQIE